MCLGIKRLTTVLGHFQEHVLEFNHSECYTVRLATVNVSRLFFWITDDNLVSVFMCFCILERLEWPRKPLSDVIRDALRETRPTYTGDTRARFWGLKRFPSEKLALVFCSSTVSVGTITLGFHLWSIFLTLPKH